jgi:hypothetical protein
VCYINISPDASGAGKRQFIEHLPKAKAPMNHGKKTGCDFFRQTTCAVQIFWMQKGAASCDATPILLTAGADRRSANAAALHQIEDAKHNDRADKGDDEACYRKFLHAADNSELVGDQVAHNRSDAACDDVPHDAHRCITIHDFAGKPAGDTANDYCNNPTHDLPPASPSSTGFNRGLMVTASCENSKLQISSAFVSFGKQRKTPAALPWGLF